MDRCALFVDAGYVLSDGAMAVHGTPQRESVSWNCAGLVKLLSSLAQERTGMPVLRCYWYEAPAEGQFAAEHDVLAEIPGLKLRLARIRPGRQDGIEAEMHRDLTTLARNGAVCDAVVATAREDLAGVLAEVQDLGMRVLLVHITGDSGWTISSALRQECDDVIELSGVHLRPFVELIAGAEPTGHDQVFAGGSYQQQGLASGRAEPVRAVTHKVPAALPAPPVPVLAQRERAQPEPAQTEELQPAPQQALVPEPLVPEPLQQPGQNTGPQPDAPHETGPQATGPQRSGLHDPRQSTGPQETGPQTGALPAAGQQPVAGVAARDQHPAQTARADQPAPSRLAASQPDPVRQDVVQPDPLEQVAAGRARTVHSPAVPAMNWPPAVPGNPGPPQPDPLQPDLRQAGPLRPVNQADVAPPGPRQANLLQPGPREPDLRQPAPARSDPPQPRVRQADPLQPGPRQADPPPFGQDTRAPRNGYQPQDAAADAAGQQPAVRGNYGSVAYAHGAEPGVRPDLPQQPGRGLPDHNGAGFAGPGGQQPAGPEPARFGGDAGRPSDRFGETPPGVAESRFAESRFAESRFAEQGRYPDGQVQNGFPQAGPGENGFPQAGQGQNGLPQPGPGQNGFPQPGPGQNGFPQPGPGQNGFPQPGTAQNGFPQPGTAQNGFPQPGQVQNGFPQAGQGQNGYAQGQNGYPGAGRGQNGYLDGGQAQAGFPGGQMRNDYPNGGQGRNGYLNDGQGQNGFAAAEPLAPLPGGHGQVQQPPAAPPSGYSDPYGELYGGQLSASAPAPADPATGMPVADAAQAAHAEGFAFGEAVAREAPALWLEAVLARKPRMPSDLESRLLQGSALPIDSLLHDEVRHSLRRGFWDALERSQRRS